MADSQIVSSKIGSWTNEKHLLFLNSMEASFVNAMFENHSHLRLDRYLADTSKSTLDLIKPQYRKYHTPSDFLGARGGKMDGRSYRRSRRRSSRPCDSVEDQVVPQIENNAAADK